MIVPSLLPVLSPIALYLVGSSKIKHFQSSEIINNDFIIRAVSSNIDLERFYGNTDPVKVLKELVDISQPDFVTIQVTRDIPVPSHVDNIIAEENLYYIKLFIKSL